MSVGLNAGDYWRERVRLPSYKVGDAARFARISPATAFRWQSIRANKPLLSTRQERASFSYLQLIELAVVALIKKAGIKFDEIRQAREYVSKELGSEFPFAEYKFKTDGASLLLNVSDFNSDDVREHLVHTGQKRGQMAWSAILPLLQHFDYEDNLVSRWLITEGQSKIFIDPKIAFGAPHIEGVATWVMGDKFKAGNSIEEIAYDYDLTAEQVREALIFENVISDNDFRCLN